MTFTAVCCRLACFLTLAAGSPLVRHVVAQPPPPAEPRAQLGLAAAGALSLYGGAARVRFARTASEFGGALDLGWIRSRRLRLVLDVELLNSVVTRRDSIDREAKGPFYDASVNVGLYASTSDGRVRPYGGVGIGLHGLGSSIGNPEIDDKYNENLFGVHASVGLAAALSADGRHGVRTEVRAVGMREVGRVSVRAGYVRFFGGLIRPRRR